MRVQLEAEVLAKGQGGSGFSRGAHEVGAPIRGAPQGTRFPAGASGKVPGARPATSLATCTRAAITYFAVSACGSALRAGARHAHQRALAAVAAGAPRTARARALLLDARAANFEGGLGKPGSPRENDQAFPGFAQ